MSDAARALDRVFRAESGAVLATLIRLLGDFQLAEDALQDALTAALESWPESGLPDAPAAWLTTIARRKAVDRLRHARIVAAKSGELSLLQRLERLVETALRIQRPGSYQIQAAIAAVHAEATSAAQTDLATDRAPVRRASALRAHAGRRAESSGRRVVRGQPRAGAPAIGTH